MTCSNPLHTSYQRIVTSYGKYQGKKNSEQKFFFLTKAFNNKEGRTKNKKQTDCTGRFV